jgi:uncharacterized membrane protein/nitrite reductase/ring-hydroxylating ferredoxin subunit
MRSKANIKGHPLHPILVSFPITFFYAAFILDGLLFFTGRLIYAQVAHFMVIAGIISALAAAIPGIIDYSSVVPPKSSAKKRATKHGLLNGAVVLLFIIVLILRLNSGDLRIILALEAIACALLVVTGWLGGTLIIRNQIGVDHRYAHAGKWSEENILSNSDTVELKNIDQLLVNQMKLFRINDKRIVVGRTETGFVAFDDHCTHRGGSLADGVMICGTVQCPWHGSQFDTKTGLVKAGPANENIKAYLLTEDNNKVFLKL